MACSLYGKRTIISTQTTMVATSRCPENLIWRFELSGWKIEMKPFGHRIAFAVLTILSCGWVQAEDISIVIVTNATPRVVFGVEKLEEALEAINFNVAIVHSENTLGRKISLNRSRAAQLGREGFSFALGADNEIFI